MINNIEDGSSKRLRQIRKTLDLTQIEFAEIINSSNGHVSDMEKGRKNITDSTMDLLELKRNVSKEWLRTGEGEMFIEIPEESEFEAAAAQLSKENDVVAMQALIQYWKLDAASRESVRQYIKNLCENIK